MEHETGPEHSYPPEQYVPQSAAPPPSAGGMYLDAYEVGFPLGANVERPTPYHLHPEAMQEPPSPFSPFILLSNLRSHLYISLEKNGWLEKRIQELEDERNFLRCQLDRFISSMRPPEDSFSEAQRVVKVQPVSSPPPSPMTTRSGMILKRLHKPQAHCSSTTNPVKQEFHLEEKFYTDEEYVEEEEDEDDDEEGGVESTTEKGSKKKVKACSDREPRMKMRRIYRITHDRRERQRVKDPEGVLIRYKKILTTYQRVRSMSRAFQIHGVDRNTMASTSPIAEMLLVAPDKLAEVGEFEAPKEKLLDYARRCYKTMDESTHAQVQSMKKTHKLLPISYRFRN